MTKLRGRGQHRCADAAAEQAGEQEKMEAFILERPGAKLAGTYPPNEETGSAFAQGRNTQGL